MEMSRIPSSFSKKLYKYDISLQDLKHMPQLTSNTRRVLLDEGYYVGKHCGSDCVSFELYTFGHLGDGNFHLNILMT